MTERDSLSTIMPCLACEGTRLFKIEGGLLERLVPCPWCTEGGMDRDQIRAWLRHEREEREAKAATKP